MSFSRSDRPEGQRSRRPGDMRRRGKVCVFCTESAKSIGYRDVATLKKYISERGKVLPRRITGDCARHQKALILVIKRTRHITLLPYRVD